MGDHVCQWQQRPEGGQGSWVRPLTMHRTGPPSWAGSVSWPQRYRHGPFLPSYKPGLLSAALVWILSSATALSILTSLTTHPPLIKHTQTHSVCSSSQTRTAPISWPLRGREAPWLRAQVPDERPASEDKPNRNHTGRTWQVTGDEGPWREQAFHRCSEHDVQQGLSSSGKMQTHERELSPKGPQARTGCKWSPGDLARSKMECDFKNQGQRCRRAECSCVASSSCQGGRSHPKLNQRQFLRECLLPRARVTQPAGGSSGWGLRRLPWKRPHCCCRDKSLGSTGESGGRGGTDCDPGTAITVMLL